MTAVTTTASAANTPRRTALRDPLLRFASRLPLLLAVLLVWEVTAPLINSAFLPPISEILQRFTSDWTSGPWYRAFLSDQFFTHSAPTLMRLGLGWLVGAVLGVAVGTLVALVGVFGAIVEPIVRFGMSLPTPALLPVALAIFGLGDGGKVFFILLGAIWPVIVSTSAGLKDADEVALRTARSMVLPPATALLRVRIPLASPQIMSGLRVSVNAAVLLIIVAELYASTSGIGFFIVSTQRNFDTLGTWSGILLLALLGMVCNGLFALIERRVMRWHILPGELNQ